MNRWGMMALALCFCSCAVKQKLEVRTYLLRDGIRAYQNDAMVDAEKSQYLYGAVTMAEQKARLGQYFTVLWSDPDAASAGEIVFLYQQGATGAKVHRSRQPILAGKTRGREVFAVVGDHYLKRGRVLAWKCELRKRGKIVNSRQSSLWQ